jgi:hypothetical protein
MARRTYTSKSRQVEPFELDGVEFHPGRISLLRLVELAKWAKVADAEDLPAEAAEAIAGLMADLLGRDYERFKAHCAAHETDDETIMAIIQDIIKDVVGPPSDRPSPSPPGPTSTGSTSSDTSPVIERVNLQTGATDWVSPSDEEWEQLMAEARQTPPTG